MRTKTVVLFSLLTLLTAGFVYGQSGPAKANIPFALNVEGKTLPAGQHEFIPDMESGSMRVVPASKSPAVLALVVTRMAESTHTTPNDSHIVFDKVGDVMTLSEIWMPGDPGQYPQSPISAPEKSVIEDTVPGFRGESGPGARRCVGLAPAPVGRSR